MTSKKTLFKNISLFLCLIPMLVLSLFCLVPKNNLKSVSAANDVTINYSFSGSTFQTALCLEGKGEYSSHTGFYNSSLSFSFNVDSSNSVIYMNKAYAYIWDYRNGYDATTNGISYTDSNGNMAVSDSVPIPMNNTFVRCNLLFYFSNHTNSIINACWVLVNSPNFTANIKSVEFGSINDHALSNFPVTWSKYNYVKYVDVNGNYLVIALTVFDSSLSAMVNSSSYQNFLFDYKRYYLNDPSNFTDNESYNFGYEAGYSSGYTDGNSVGNTQGYENGYSAGETIGYGNGYNDGIEQSNNYSFLSLIGAVIDAPVSAFTSLLNFNLLGFNMLGFVTGLLTLSLIIFIVKLILGGK